MASFQKPPHCEIVISHNPDSKEPKIVYGDRANGCFAVYIMINDKSKDYALIVQQAVDGVWLEGFDANGQYFVVVKDDGSCIINKERVLWVVKEAHARCVKQTLKPYVTPDEVRLTERIEYCSSCNREKETLESLTTKIDKLTAIVNDVQTEMKSRSPLPDSSADRELILGYVGKIKTHIQARGSYPDFTDPLKQDAARNYIKSVCGTPTQEPRIVESVREEVARNIEEWTKRYVTV